MMQRFLLGALGPRLVDDVGISRTVLGPTTTAVTGPVWPVKPVLEEEGAAQEGGRLARELPGQAGLLRACRVAPLLLAGLVLVSGDDARGEGQDEQDGQRAGELAQASGGVRAAARVQGEQVSAGQVCGRVTAGRLLPVSEGAGKGSVTTRQSRCGECRVIGAGVAARWGHG
ncbi:hypothetical protein [Streptomyces sp. Rer75]|uniref:hypothetical protein n=1 Tax=unclassified Streptomyces TaxID=2593676 RepID=UPI00211DB2D7|nr:hypothetical protein [Streptomyces sp. Rer75]